VILLLDNHDSFVYNLDRYLKRLGNSTLVVRSDAITIDAIGRLKPQAIVISPGPKSPDEAGCSMEVVRRMSAQIPILGICLGHQAIGQALGGKIVRASRPMHGKSSTIEHDGSRMFRAIPTRFEVGRYHSLMVDKESLPTELTATAWSGDGTIMALEHRTLPMFGLQFHPESILTEYGYQLLINFLSIVGIEPHQRPSSDLSLVNSRT
jgi:anthranilate synthase component II